MGTVQFGLDYGINNKEGKLPKSKIFELLHQAHKLGIDTLDTAEAYGNAHDVIKEFHNENSYRFKIISKYSPNVKKYSDNIVDRLKCHIENFDVSILDGYLFHSFNHFKLSLEQDSQILEKIENSGLVKKIGVSLYTNKELEEVLNYSKIKLIQIPFNLFDNHFKRYKFIEKAKSKGIEIHTRSAFLQGLFFKKIDDLQGNLIELKEDLKKIDKLSKSYRLNKATVALNYAYSKPYIDKTLIGVDNLCQLKSNIESLNYKLPESLVKKIDEINILNDNLLNPSQWL